MHLRAHRVKNRGCQSGEPRTAQMGCRKQQAASIRDNRGQTKKAAALQLLADKRCGANSTIQMLRYKHVVYKPEDHEKFKAVALEDIGEPLNLQESVVGALGALAYHDPNGVIGSAEELKRILTLGLGDQEALILQELSQVEEAAATIGDNTDAAIPEVNTEPFEDGHKGRVEGYMDNAEEGMEMLDDVGLQSKKYPGKRKIPETVKGEAAKKQIDKSKQLLPQLLNWVRPLPQKLRNSALRWQAKGSLGLTIPQGRSHLNIGPKTKTKGLYRGGTEEKHATLWADPWTPGVNDAWIKAGKRRSLDFHVVTEVPEGIREALLEGDKELFVEEAIKDADTHDEDPKKSYFWNKSTGSLTRLGGEIVELLEAGYRLVRTG